MSQFNKNNPFVILSKELYDDIIDSIQLATRNFIKHMISICGLGVVLLGISTLGEILSSLKLSNLCIMALVAIIIFVCGIFMYFRYITSRYMNDHPAMKEFTRISRMELNEIVKIGNEEILQCLHGLYDLHGSLKIELRDLHVIAVSIILTEVALIICFSVQILFYIIY